MKTPSVNSRILKLEVSKDTATRASVNAVESRTTSLESDVATAQGDISTLQGDVATLTQGIQDSVSTHNTSPDSHADIRTLIADRALIEHQHARTDLPWVTDPGASLLTAASASAQRTALGMTAWAMAPWTDGTTSDIPEGTQLYFTADRANTCADARIAAQKGQAEGIMPLDSGGKAPLAYMPDALIGQVKFKGVWDAATNSPVLPSATASMGHYYVTSVAGSYGGIDYDVGDWCISDGTTWGKVDNTDAVVSFNGRIGAILPIASDYAAHYLGLHAQADDAAKLGGQLPAYYAQASHTHTQSVIDSSTGWITDALEGKQASGNYAASATPGGAATEALTCTGNSATASYATYPRFSGDAVVPAAFDLTQRTGSGIYEGYQENVTLAKGWPVDAQYTNLIAATHSNRANYYSLQIAGPFTAQRFFARNTGNNGSTPWVELVHTGNIAAAFNYAGSATPGGPATSAESCSGNSATANVAKYPQFSEDAMDPAGMDITQRISSGIYQGSGEYTSTTKGWPMNGEWTHLIAATHNNKGNNYSMQVAGHFYTQRFFARNTNNNGATPWVELLHNGNVGFATPDGALSIAKTSGLQKALNLRAVGYPLTWFGGDGSESSPNTWTTAQFITFLVNCGAFDQPQWSSRGTWNYVGNRVITDTGVGHIHLAGATVEVFKGTQNEYMVRVTTGPATSVSGAVPKAVFIYENHGADYAPGWFRLMSAEQYPNLQAIENLADTAGVPVKTAANTWDLKNGATASVVIGGTTLNFQNGVLMSVST